MQTHNTADDCERTSAKNEEESQLLARRSMDGSKRRDWKEKDPDVSDNIEGRGCYVSGTVHG